MLKYALHSFFPHKSLEYQLPAVMSSSGFPEDTHSSSGSAVCRAAFMESVVNYAYTCVPSGKNIVLQVIHYKWTWTTVGYLNTWHPQVRLKPNRIQSHVAFVIQATQGIEARTHQQCRCLPFLLLTIAHRLPGLNKSFWNPSLLAEQYTSGLPHQFLECPLHCIS